MSDLNKALEGLVGDMGMSISDETPQQTEQPTEQTAEAPVETVQDEPQPEVESAQEEPQQEAAVEEQPQSTLQEEEISDSEMESVMLEYLSERLGRKVSSLLSNQNLLQKKCVSTESNLTRCVTSGTGNCIPFLFNFVA